MVPDPIHRASVLVDTNLLLLKVVGEVDPERIPRFKRTAQFTVGDYDLLTRLLKRFASVLTTPHILAEVSNFLGQLGSGLREDFFRSFAGNVEVIAEHHVAGVEAARETAFLRLGLTDIGISLLARNGCLVLTVDLDLFLYLKQRGLRAENFNYLRFRFRSS